MWMFNGYGMGAGGWVLMGLFWIALIALVVFAAVRLFPTNAEKRDAPEEKEKPKEILRRRLASGEIDVQTFDELSSKLGAGTSTGAR